MSTEKWLALEEEGGKVFLVQIVDETIKIKGLGVFNPVELLAGKSVGETVIIGQKNLDRFNSKTTRVISWDEKKSPNDQR